MIIEKNRHLKVLSMLMKASEPVSSQTLADFSRASVRTIKSDIVYLNAKLEEEGVARIVSSISKGYSLEVLDMQAYEELADTLAAATHLYEDHEIEVINRRMYILQRLLTEEYTKLEEIADQLYLSRSALKNDISWSSSFLNSYNIKVVSTPGRGLSLKGKEQDIRSAMVESHCSQYHNFNQLFPYEPFNQLFFEDRQEYENIRHSFLKILRDSPITIPDIVSKKLATHLCLMRNRIKTGHPVILENALMAEITATYDYKFCKMLFAHEEIRCFVKADDMEVANFARLLIANRNINFRMKGDEHLPISLLIENDHIYNQVIKMVKTPIFKTELYKNYILDLKSTIMELYLCHHFDSTRKQRLVTYAERQLFTGSPIDAEFTRSIVYRLSDIFGESITDCTPAAISSIFEQIMKIISYPYRKLNVIIGSINGITEAALIREQMQNAYYKYLDRVELCNVYEARRLDFSKYDFFLFSGMILYYSYPIPLVEYHNLDYSSQKYSNLFNDMFFYGYRRDYLDYLKSITTVINEVKITDYVGFVENLSYRYCFDNEVQKKCWERILKTEKLIPRYYRASQTAVVFFAYEETKREFVEIYRIKTPASYSSEKELRYVIAYSISPESSLGNVKLLDRILLYLVQVDGSIAKLGQNINEQYDRIFFEIVRRSFKDNRQ